MSFVGDFVSDLFGGDDAEEAAQDAAQIQAAAQREALDYLKAREALPQRFREESLTRLAGLSGLPGGEGDQQELIDRAIASPYYQARTGRPLEQAEKAIMRRAAATGGLRSGNVQAALADTAAGIEERALADAYAQQVLGLTELSQLPSQARAIAGQTAGIGQTLAQGEIAGAQARQQALGTGINTAFGLGGLILGI